MDWPCGAVATAWLASRTLVKEVECRPTRILSGGGYRAQCYVGGVDIAAAGLGQGMYVLVGREQEYSPPGYAEIEAKAKAANTGIWSSEFMTPASGAAPMAPTTPWRLNDNGIALSQRDVQAFHRPRCELSGRKVRG